VLIVDDEPDLARLLVYNLHALGFATETATTGAAGLAAAVRNPPSVVVLDVMLPDLAGTDVCRRMRADPALAAVGILMLTALGAEEDRILGLEVGADDYVVKPYSVKEVCLRVRALARRAGDAPRGGGLRWGDIEVDRTAHRVRVAGAEVPFRPLEFKLLTLFLEQEGRLLSREDILGAVWGATEISARTVDVHVRRLREKLGASGDALETVHGFGYRWREE
jgi:two-component system phosphate regulon response regulator PhoB